MLVVFLWSSSLNAQEVLLDRLVVEVNSVTYTQRQVELFYGVFQAISLEDSKDFTGISPANWSRVLQEYIRFMLIEQEAHRLGSYFPSNNMIEKATEVFLLKKQRDPEIAKLVTRLFADRKSIRQSIVSVLRVASFLRSKMRRAGTDSKTDKKMWLDFAEQEWFQQLMQRAIIRYLSDGQRYREIQSI